MQGRILLGGTGTRGGNNLNDPMSPEETIVNRLKAISHNPDFRDVASEILTIVRAENDLYSSGDHMIRVFQRLVGEFKPERAHETIDLRNTENESSLKNALKSLDSMPTLVSYLHDIFFNLELCSSLRKEEKTQERKPFFGLSVAIILDGCLCQGEMAKYVISELVEQ